MKYLIDKLITDNILQRDEFLTLLENRETLADYIQKQAQIVSDIHFHREIYLRGLIEVSNHCKNNCYYCGIGSGNLELERYRLTKDEILSCCQTGYALGIRTFVLQSGEDPELTDEIMVDLIGNIRSAFPDCAITISMGEKSYDSYLKLYHAGANRYLLRHESANDEHYRRLHPPNLSLSERIECLWNLKKIGYQIGTGFMVGSPFQTYENIVEDLLFLHKLQPQMVGIGPFIPHRQTRFAGYETQGIDLTLFLVSVIRLMLPNVLIPATTAVGTLDTEGREKAILSGANVLMPNLSPVNAKQKYDLYDNKVCVSEDAAESSALLSRRVERIGYHVVESRGDYKPM